MFGHGCISQKAHQHNRETKGVWADEMAHREELLISEFLQPFQSDLSELLEGHVIVWLVQIILQQQADCVSTQLEAQIRLTDTISRVLVDTAC